MKKYDIVQLLKLKYKLCIIIRFVFLFDIILKFKLFYLELI